MKTISVNEDPFFFSPIDGIQCQSDGATTEGGTARTSPYDYVTTVVYPDSAKGTAPPLCGDANWSSVCTNPQCFGVPLYRLYQTGPEHAAGSPPGFIRMAATAICQRETMSVNHGLYYVDLTASAATQTAFGSSTNIFTGGKTYDFFLIFAKATTVLTYQMFVGTGLATMPAVTPIRVNIGNAPFIISQDTLKSGLVPPPAYNSTTGILTVTLNLLAYASDFTSAATALCQPRLFCQPTTGHGGVRRQGWRLRQSDPGRARHHLRSRRRGC